MTKKVILAIIINIFLAMSMYSLMTLVNREAKELDETSHLRFSYFIGMHAMLFISIFVMVRLQDVYSYMILGFINSVTASISLMICESEVRRIQNSPFYSYRKFAGKTQKLELTFLNIYFLVYMYAIIGLIITSLFLLVTELLICWEEHSINSKISQCLTRRGYDESVKGLECSICLQEFEQADRNLIEVNICSHLFHEKCLIEWVRHSNTCPLDRKDIFEFGSEQIQAADRFG